MPCIIFQDEERAILIPKGINILQACLENKIPIYAECGGKGVCTTCRIKVLSGHENLMSRSQFELKIASSRKWDKTIRLACQTRVLGDIAIEKAIRNEEECAYTYLENYYSTPIIEKNLAILGVKIFNFDNIINNFNALAKEKLETILSIIRDIAILNGGYIVEFQPRFILIAFGLYESSEYIQNAFRAGLLIRDKFLDIKEKFNDNESIKNLQYGIFLHSAPLKIISIEKFHSFMLEGKGVHEINFFSKALKHFSRALLLSNSFYESFENQKLECKRFQITNKQEHTEKVYIVKENIAYDVLYDIFQSHLKIRERKTDFFNEILQLASQKNSNLAEKIGGEQERLKAHLFHLYNQVIFGLTRFSVISDMIYETGRIFRFSSLHESDITDMKEIFCQSLKNFLRKDWNENLEKSWNHLLEKILETTLKGFNEAGT